MPVIGKQKSLVIQCALPIEARAVAARLRHARRGSIGLFEAWEGQWDRVPILLVVSGMGTSEASICARETLRLFDACGIIDFGTAGALSETSAIGKIAVIRTAAAYQPPLLLPLVAQTAPAPPVQEVSSDPDWLRVAQEKLDLPAVYVGCADKPVMSVHLARHLAATYGFDWVDVESHAVLEAAARQNIRALGLRVVSDHCGTNAPEQFALHARRVLADAARMLQKLVVVLHKEQLLTPRPG